MLAPRIGTLAAQSSAPPAPSLRAQKLTWAGVRLQLESGSLFLDPLINKDVWGDGLKDPMIPVGGASGDRFVLVTHRHPDHCDPEAIHQALGNDGTLVYASEAGIPNVSGVKMRAAAMYEPVLLGDFTATAVPAVDGYGDPQVSWIVSAGGRRIIHCGDTLWHGAWWRIGRQYGPFDAAFLPINGARFSWRKKTSDRRARGDDGGTGRRGSGRRGRAAGRADPLRSGWRGRVCRRHPCGGRAASFRQPAPGRYRDTQTRGLGGMARVKAPSSTHARGSSSIRPSGRYDRVSLSGASRGRRTVSRAYRAPRLRSACT